jgi:small-conductance mechanosensitive channel
MVVLSALGVNIGPLLAGAGVVGIAVGFGAQTLVRDVLSGMFFLMDDAFRKGEYIDIGSVKGTVERISVRSLQLRHHNGPVHTVPYGEIQYVTNFSRDWSIMKFELRIPFETDVDMVRRIIKKVGQELMHDEEIAPFMLEPLKSQGVNRMDDSAFVVRCKFTTIPGQQFYVRRIAYTAIQRAFEEKGIKFAPRRVIVEATVPESDKDGGVSQPAAAALAAAAAGALASEQVEDEAPADDRG